ncbi:hypothetical protein ONS95_002270 [Cadophora gregata]|uniref:uncharacterized protein n=1 Tax=Cadophora gregata TaxID=51156 RepID=UPI0026DB3E70|nr:uncharacterized protein ONS95_002270 [Cadophora gregata]KAK0109585.1 hypothetical protein ONS95_002270 [Cadophora gregata]KAK0110782.1 hypothetical protein ONS96_002379 [Cadophora gregata f. sp. sojae]
MPVTEFAIIHFKHDKWEEASHRAPPPQAPSIAPSLEIPSNVLTKLSTAREYLQRASGHTFRFFQQFEDPFTIHIIGKWDSTESHTAFLSSAENQYLLELMREHISSGEGNTGIQMWHLDVDVFDYPSLKDSWLSSATLVAYQRYTISTQGSADHSQGFDDMIARMRIDRSAAGGWRIEKEAEDDEWMVFFDFKVKDDEKVTQGLGGMELATPVDELHMVAIERL